MTCDKKIQKKIFKTCQSKTQTFAETQHLEKHYSGLVPDHQHRMTTQHLETHSS